MRIINTKTERYMEEESVIQGKILWILTFFIQSGQSITDSRQVDFSRNPHREFLFDINTKNSDKVSDDEAL